MKKFPILLPCIFLALNSVMSRDKLSIVITCFNDHLYLEEAVDSAYSQTWKNKEIILVDDGSNKVTKTAIDRVKSKVDVLISQENLGVSAARNNGIKASTGEFILILDSDDYYESEFSEKAIQVLKDYPNVKLVTSLVNWFSDKDSVLFKPEGGILKDFLLRNQVLNVLYRKRDFEVSGGYDEKMDAGFEDWELYLRILKDRGEAKVIPEVLFNYRNKPKSRNKTANLRKYELLEYIYVKHSELYKANFEFFIQEWLESVKKSEAFKQRVMDSMDYKVGNKFLKPIRALGFFKNKPHS